MMFAFNKGQFTDVHWYLNAVHQRKCIAIFVRMEEMLRKEERYTHQRSSKLQWPRRRRALYLRALDRGFYRFTRRWRVFQADVSL